MTASHRRELRATLLGYAAVVVPFVGFMLWAAHAHPGWFG